MRKLGRLPGSWAWFLLAGATLLGPYRLRAQAADVSTDEPVDNAVVKRYHAVLPSTKELAAIPGFAAEPTTIDAAFQRLVKGYRVELYPRALRGSRGTFLAKAGNSLDRALLLYTLVSSNPGNGVQSATIAYARLSPEEAARVYDSCDHGLTARLAEQRAAFRVLDDRAAAAGVQDASLRKMQQIRAGILSRLDQFLQQDLAMVAPHLADSAAKAAANLA